MRPTTRTASAIATGADDPFVGLVWRTVNDPFVGQLTFVRVLGGTLKSDSRGHERHPRTRRSASARCCCVNGKKQEPVEAATAGDIVAIPKLKATAVGDTLCAVGHEDRVPADRVSRSRSCSRPCTAKTQADEDKIGTALQRVCEEDPTLHVDRNTRDQARWCCRGWATCTSTWPSG